MTAVPTPDFSGYLRSIVARYEKWWELYTLTDVTRQRKVERQIDQASPFDFSLLVKTVKQSTQEQFEQQSEKSLEKLPVLEGIRKYAFNPDVRQILLVGRPGSGKSTALARLLLEEATSPSDKIPALVELRYWQGSIVELIRSAFKRHNLPISEATLEKLLDQNQLLLLFDGVNELPSDHARSQLTAFRRQYPQATMIFTTRDLSLGGDLGIEKKLEMQPLTETQMSEFVRSYLGIEQGEQLLRQLKDRLRELGQTPLLLWILCEVVQQLPESKLPENLGGVFKVFTQSYKLSAVRKHEVAALKGDVRPLSDRRLWDNALQCLAFVMMQGKTDVDFRVVLDKAEAECELTNLFRQEPSPSKTARDCLDDLLNYHLLQLGNNPDQIEFRHQLIQEYYAAEALLAKLDHLSEDQLKGNYLNYLKWTEPIALMLALLEDDEKALAIVQWALDIDLMLGARLAGAVRPGLQGRSVMLLTDQTTLLAVNEIFKLELLGITGSDEAIPLLADAMRCPDFLPRKAATIALYEIRSEKTIPLLLENINHPDLNMRWNVMLGLLQLEQNQGGTAFLEIAEDIETLVRSTSFREFIEAHTNMISNQHIESMVEAHTSIISNQYLESIIEIFSIKDKNFKNEYSDHKFSDNFLENFNKLEDNLSHRCNFCITELHKRYGADKAIPWLFDALDNSDPLLRRGAVTILGEIGSKEVVPGLLKALQDSDLYARRFAAEALGAIGNPHTLEDIWKKQFQTPDQCFTKAISVIQSRCKFYNHEVYERSKAMREQTVQKKEKLETMTDGAKYNFPNAQKVQIIEKLENYHEHNYAAQPDKSQAVAEIHQLLESLEHQYPTVTEAEAKNIIEAEIVSIQTHEPQRWQMLRKELLNRERWFNGGKAALVEATQTLADKLWLNVLVAFIDGFSADI